MHWYCISNAYSSHQLNGSTDLQKDSNLTNIRMKCLGVTIPTNIMSVKNGHLECHAGVEIIWSKHDNRITSITRSKDQVHKNLKI